MPPTALAVSGPPRLMSGVSRTISVAWIRISRFDDFKGAETLLIEADRAGFRVLINAIEQLQDSVAPMRLDQ